MKELSRSEWSEIFIPSVDGYPLNFNDFPWTMKPLDSDAKRIAVRKGAQIGFSVALCVCRALYDIYHGRNVLIVQPRQVDAKDFQTRLIGVINDLPDSMTEGVKAREGLIQFPEQGTKLYIRSSGSKTTGIRSIPADTVIVDEASAVKLQAFSQAMSRLDASKSKCFIALSTPTIPGTGISDLYLAGDQQQWLIGCLHCGDNRGIAWEDFQLYSEAPERSFVRCPVCQTPRPDDKATWVGEWKATSEAPNDTESYTVNQLVSHRVSNKEIAEKAIAAHRDASSLKNFYNDQLGIEWLSQDANRLQNYHVRACVKPYRNLTTIPRDSSDVHLLGLDQGTRNHFVVAKVSFLLGNNRPAIDAAILQVVAMGTTTESDWEAVRRIQRDYQCWVTVADRAGSSKILAQEFARTSPYPTWLAQYIESSDLAEFRESEQASYPLVWLNRNWSLSQYQSRIKRQGIIFPADLEESWLNQITATTMDANGKRFVKLGDDHIAHCLGYVETALRLAIKHFEGRIKWTRRAQ